MKNTMDPSYKAEILKAQRLAVKIMANSSYGVDMDKQIPCMICIVHIHGIYQTYDMEYNLK